MIVSRSTGQPRRVAVYVSWQNGLPAARALCETLRRNGDDPVIFLAPGMDPADVPDEPGTSVVQTTRRDRIANNTAAVLVRSLTSLALGDNDRLPDEFRPSNRIVATVHAVLRRIPRVSPKTLNRTARILTSLIVSDAFHANAIYAIAPVSFPVLLNRRGTKATAVIDSWDQPIRRTAGFVANEAVAWNLDLAEDWRRVQGCANTGTMPATRLEYALALRRSAPAEINDKGYLLYPMATTAQRRAWYEGELRLVEAICSATVDSGRELLLKPKPNSGPGDLESLAARFPHVRVGNYLSETRSSDWLITPSYDQTRLSEMAGAYCVISTATTFALDAATAGVPILQLDIRNMVELGQFADAAHNSHLVRHLYPRMGRALAAPRTLADLSDVIRALPQQEAEMVEASDALAEWIWHRYLPERPDAELAP